MKVNKNMVSGNTAMLILKLISEKDMYGYEMIDTLSKRSDNVFELKVGTLYPCLLYTSPSPRDPKTSRMPSSA